MCVTNKGVPKELECPFFYIWGRYPGKSQTWIAENKIIFLRGFMVRGRKDV